MTSRVKLPCWYWLYIYSFPRSHFVGFTKNFVSFEPLTNPIPKAKIHGSGRGKSTLLRPRDSSQVVTFEGPGQKVNKYDSQRCLWCFYSVCPLYFAKQPDCDREMERFTELLLLGTFSLFSCVDDACQWSPVFHWEISILSYWVKSENAFHKTAIHRLKDMVTDSVTPEHRW